MLNLHSLKKNNTARPSSKRLGRGDGSGVGSYSARGIKGQRSRSGGKSGLTLRSIKSYLLRIPKNRGFKSYRAKMAVVNVSDLEKMFTDGAHVNFRALLKSGLITDITKGVKILSDGKLTKKLKVEANAFSKAAKASIEKAGGEVIHISKKKKSKAKVNPSADGETKETKE